MYSPRNKWASGNAVNVTSAVIMNPGTRWPIHWNIIHLPTTDSKNMMTPFQRKKIIFFHFTESLTSARRIMFIYSWSKPETKNVARTAIVREKYFRTGLNVLLYDMENNFKNHGKNESRQYIQIRTRRSLYYYLPLKEYVWEYSNDGPKNQMETLILALDFVQLQFRHIQKHVWRHHIQQLQLVHLMKASKCIRERDMLNHCKHSSGILLLNPKHRLPYYCI